MEEKNEFLKVDENRHNENQKKNIIIVLAVSIVLCAIVLTIILISAVASLKKNENTTRYEMTTNYLTESTTDEEYLNSILGINTDVQTDVETEAPVTEQVQQQESEKTTKNEIIEHYEQLSPNGENKLSDHYDNEFIKLVAQKYKVDADLLVAIYSVPDSGTNFVLQFSGKKDISGKYVKSPDTLEKVYQIDLQRNIKVATGKEEGNEGVSYGESVLCMGLVKAVVMEQYPNYFTGLKK